MTTEERLAKVERELARAKRRSRWLLAALGLGLGALALVWASAANVPKAEAQGAADGRTVLAERFELVNAQSKVRAYLEMAKDGPMLCLADAAGRPRAMLAVREGGPGLALFDENGKSRATLFALKDGPRLALFDENGKSRAALVVDKDGVVLSLFDATGKPFWSTP